MEKTNKPKNHWFNNRQGAKKPTVTEHKKKDAQVDKFQQARKQHVAALQKYTENFEYSSDEEEDDLNVNQVLDLVFKNYLHGEDKGNGINHLQSGLQEKFLHATSTCLICISSVKRTETVWNCTECYCIFHLTCIQRWSKDTVTQQKLALEAQIQISKIKVSWACPKCRHEYGADIPNVYKCFCTKTENPVYEPLLVPHSCGEICRKKLKPSCGHLCVLLCHPGPCPPCPQTINVTCYCGIQPPRPQRCSKQKWSCGLPCNKLLACGKHKCNTPCHFGDCPPCSKKSIQKCLCGSSHKLRSCAEPIWQCDKVCNNLLECGHHSCLEICHSGSCGTCILSQPRTCPCGKTTYNLSCTEETPTCEETCGKLLECGVHVCYQRCHKDKCGLCFELVTKSCHCGMHSKEIQCHKQYYCDTKCRQMKDCNKHSCNRKCCDGNCPPCEKPCGRTLKCGNHKCSSICHRGPCYPCQKTQSVSCRCGDTILTVPCGRKQKTRPPKCNKICRLPSNCHHSKREDHNCHFGDCPPCKLICEKSLRNCDHKCPTVCHSAVPIKIEEEKASTPWEQTGPQIVIKDLPCPDCQVPVLVTCFGGHETCNWPCFRSKPSSCHRPCGRLLQCGNHKCTLPCHIVEDPPDEITAGKNCEECSLQCDKSRPVGCSHKCLKPCHPGSCPKCSQMIRIKCYCNLTELYVACKEWTIEENKTKLQSCGNQCPKYYPCGHRCKENCHSGECSNADLCKKRVKVTCDCKTIRKEFTCDLVRSGSAIVKCDEQCYRKLEEEKRAKLLLDEKKKKEEELKNLKELEMFEKKFMGKKKSRNYKKIDNVQEETFFRKYKVAIIVAGLLFILGSSYWLVQ